MLMQLSTKKLNKKYKNSIGNLLGVRVNTISIVNRESKNRTLEKVVNQLL